MRVHCTHLATGTDARRRRRRLQGRRRRCWRRGWLGRRFRWSGWRRRERHRADSAGSSRCTTIVGPSKLVEAVLIDSGAFIDAQMDKFVFCTCLWSFLVLIEYASGSFTTNAVVVLTSVALLALEMSIAVVRTTDYFVAKHSKGQGGQRALRAVSEGKLKQKFESVGIALYCLTLPNADLNMFWGAIGTACLWFAVYFSVQSLAHKLRARTAAYGSASH